MSELTKPAPIVTTGLAKFEASPTVEAAERKNELLELSSLILSVSSEDEQMDAIDATSQIKAVEQGVEATRKLIKAPVLEAGKIIDDACRKFLDGLTKERLRIEGLLTGYALEKRREHEIAVELQRAEEEEKREEADRLERERQAEYTRQQAEAAKMNAPPPEPPAPLPAVVVHSAPLPPPPKMEGASLKVEKDYEVTDIHALYAWNRLFVKLEDDRQNLKAYVNMPGVKVDQIPGIRVFESAKTITRAARSTSVRVIE